MFSGAQTAVLDDYRTATFYGPDGRSSTELRTQDKGHRAEIAAFVEGVRLGTAPIPADELENVSLATLAAVESLRTGGPVTLAATAQP